MTDEGGSRVHVERCCATGVGVSPRNEKFFLRANKWERRNIFNFVKPDKWKWRVKCVLVVLQIHFLEGTKVNSKYINKDSTFCRKL